MYRTSQVKSIQNHQGLFVMEHLLGSSRYMYAQLYKLCSVENLSSSQAALH